MTATAAPPALPKVKPESEADLLQKLVDAPDGKMVALTDLQYGQSRDAGSMLSEQQEIDNEIRELTARREALKTDLKGTMFWDAVEPGDVVHWWKNDKRPLNPHAAIVTSVQEGGRISLSAIVKNSRWVMVEDTACVPHENDPSPKSPHLARYGHWALRPQEKNSRARLAAAETRLVKLEEELGELKAALS